MKTLLSFFFLTLSLTCINTNANAAQQAANCHCFKDRFYDPADKFAADDYLLTTTFNSLIAAGFDISKRQIVMMKMKGGVASDDLLIGMYVGKKSGLDINNLLSMRKKSSWRDIIGQLDMQNPSAKDNLLEKIKNGLSDNSAAEEVGKNMLQQYFGASENAIKSLNQSGLSIREINLVLILNRRTGTTPEMISTLHRKQGLSWSEITHNFGITPADAGKFYKTTTDSQAGFAGVKS